MAQPQERQPDMIPAAQVEAMVEERVKAAVADVEKRLAELITSAVAAPQAGDPMPADTASMNALAMAIATLTDQGTGRKRIAPEEMVKREQAHQKMLGLIDEARRAGIEPVYKLRSLVFLGEQKIQPVWIDERHRQQPTEIGWSDIPNEAMEPVCDTAQGIYAAFADSIGAVAQRDMGPMRVTASGLTVLKGAPAMQGEAEHTSSGAPSSLTPTIRGRGAPGPVIERRILGTVMPPARQNP